MVVPVDCMSSLLPSVMALGRKNSNFLGHYPRGAFEDAAQREHILAAVEGDSLLGYVLFRISREHVSIVHLCVSKEARGRGVTHILFNELKQRTQECVGVKLRCRRDYPASSLWPKLGFLPVSERAGRSTSGELLTTWFYSYGHPTLFAAIADQETRLPAVLDANILFDLQDRPDRRAIRGLTEPWLTMEVEFCLAREMYFEINRSASAIERERRRIFAQQFRTLEVNHIEEERIRRELSSFFPAKRSDSDESDLKQLTQAIAGGARFFVTWDSEQLRRAAEVEERFGIAVLRPLDLVVGFDARLRQAEYAPARVAGSLTTVTRVGPRELERLQAAFQCFRRRESKGAFIDAVNAATVDPHGCETKIIVDRSQRDVALFSFDLRDSAKLVVPLLRLNRTNLARGLAEHIAWSAVGRARQEGRQVVEVTESLLEPVIEDVLRACDFLHLEGVWRKHLIHICGPRREVVAALEDRQKHGTDPIIEVALQGLRSPNAAAFATSIARLERFFWPLHITDTALSTYVVPIRPAFAGQLFDEQLAAQELFGAAEHLAFSMRNVYYRSAGGMRVPGPSRVLWYVSKGRGYQHASSITAVSLVEESVRGPAKELYRRFQRLGAYDWQQILSTVRGDLHAPMEAFTFTHTQLFENPVPYQEIQMILEKNGRPRNTFPGPMLISEECFSAIYHWGTRRPAEAA